MRVFAHECALHAAAMALLWLKVSLWLGLKVSLWLGLKVSLWLGYAGP